MKNSQLIAAIAFTFSWGIQTSVVPLQAIAANPKCDLYAYVTDPDPNGLNVRNGPGNGNRVVGQIPTNATVKVIANASNWTQVTNASDGYQGTGWVATSKLGLSTKGYGTSGVNLHASASSKSRSIGTVPPETAVKFLGCQGQWAQVQYQNLKGWLARPDQCGAALTTCS